MHCFGNGFHSVAAENTRDVVLHRNVEHRAARVALTSATASQLVVDTSAFVAFRADDAQTAECDNLFFFLVANRLKRVVVMFVHLFCRNDRRIRTCVR